MAALARREHERRIKIGWLKTSVVHFDEMESFEHTRLKPLSIALGVRAKTGEIVDARVAQINCKGRLAPISVRKYGWRQDKRDIARNDVLGSIHQCSREHLLI